MKNVGEKIDTLRTATAHATVIAAAKTIERLIANDVPKKDILPIARAAAVMAAKNTPNIIPYCHPLPIDAVDVDFKVSATEILVSVSVSAIWKTGVEMEALTAASAAALTIYDMLKPIDKNLEIRSTRLIEKKGGKSDWDEAVSAAFRASVIVTSDGTSAGKRPDKSGKIIADQLQKLGIQKIDYTILPDEKDQIQKKILADCEQGIDLVITTGGTGLGPRDVTVEATRPIIEREMPAVIQALQNYGLKRTPHAMLSRGVAGVRGKTVIVNLPGSSGGARDGMTALFPHLLHVYKMMAGGGHP